MWHVDGIVQDTEGCAGAGAKAIHRESAALECDGTGTEPVLGIGRAACNSNLSTADGRAAVAGSFAMDDERKAQRILLVGMDERKCRS